MRHRKLGSWRGLLFAAVVGSACSDPESVDDAPNTDTADTEPGGTAETGEPVVPPTDPLFELGSHAVGFRQLEVTYPDVVTGEDRTIGLALWYPALHDGEPLARYAVGGLVEVPTDVALDAPAPDPRPTPYPVAIYSHGSGGEALVGYPYAEHLASHGWLVAAPNHTGNTALEGLDDSFDPVGRIALDRPADVTAVLDWLEGSGDALQGVGRTDAVLVFGHSFGAYTTLASAGAQLDFEAMRASCNMADTDCSIYDDPAIEQAYAAGFGDPRVAAIVAQAPALVGQLQGGSLADLSVPTMLQSARRDITTPHETQAMPAWEALDGPEDVWVELPEGGHLSFITVCDDLQMNLVEAFRPTAYEDGCGPDFIPIATAVALLTAYLDAFARVHLLGEEEWSTLLRAEPIDPAIEITVR